MELLADRFVAPARGRVVDLATGEDVVLVTRAAGDPAEQTQWLLRCDGLQKLHRCGVAALVDYGALDRVRRFEAWSGAPPEESTQRDGAGNNATARSSPAIVSQEPSCFASLADLFVHADDQRPHVVAVWGETESGKSTLATALARVARVHGFVPVASALLGSAADRLTPLAETLSSRTLFIIDDEDGEGAEALARAVVRTPRPHVLLLIRDREPRAIDGVALETMSASALIGALRPQPTDARAVQRAMRAAERSRGRPGAFVRLLWGLPGRRGDRHAAQRQRGVCSALRAAEPRAVYDAGETEVPATGASPAPREWPAPGELATLRRKMDLAARQIHAGRHAPGERLLRQALGGLVRRADWDHAASGAATLAAAMLTRGRIEAARTAIAEGEGYCRRGADPLRVIDFAVLAAIAWTDLARLADAETTAAGALASSRAHDTPVRAAHASRALARVLFWRGRFAESTEALADIDRDALDAPGAVRVAIAEARAAIGTGDVSRAVPVALDAVVRAEALGDAALVADACGCAAFAHLAVGDVEAVPRDVAASVAAARQAHDPLRAVRSRLIAAEAERRRGRRSAAATIAARLQAIAARVPPIVRARIKLLVELLEAPPTAVGDAVARQITETGLAALQLFAPAPRPAVAPASSLEAVAGEVVEILRACQTAEEEPALLGEISARLRQQLHASAVGFVACDGASVQAVGGDTARIDPALVSRAMAAGLTVGPDRVRDGIEAAAPIRYAGATLGALAARWTLGTPHDLTRAAPVLTMAAAAAAPAVAAVHARRARQTAACAHQIVGVSPAIVDLRTAIDRAAPAPFSVLVVGESGSGKELVARALHRAGPRRDRPFCALNCAALPDDLVEAELFGHARGAFTGALGERAGVFEEAHGGTLFLDEIGELSPRAQAKVLRAVQEGELRRVGENIARRIDVRLVSATNRDLARDVEAGRFRLDLLYRLDVIRIALPPLRDRRDDVPLLVDHFWREATGRINSRAVLAPATVAALVRYDWPGNVRELQNVLAALAVRAPRRGVVPPAALPPAFVDRAASDVWRLDEARRSFEERFVRAALVRSGGHRTRAAAELGVTRQGLAKLMARLGMVEEKTTL